jgi:dCMP deaminase
MRITRAEMLMQIAEIVAERGTCSRARVGAILVRDGRVLSTGYNGAPAGVDHCAHPCDCHSDPHRDGCSTRRPCLVAVHAEINAITYAARFGVSTEGADLYTTLSPCVPCVHAIINSGIRRVVYLADYRTRDGIDLLGRSKVLIEQFSSDMIDA